MGVKYNHTQFEQETQRWRPGTGFASGGPRFQNLSKMAKKCLFFGICGCLSGPWGGGIGKETDIHTMNDHLWSLSSGFYTQVVHPTTSLWVQNTAKSALKGTHFA